MNKERHCCLVVSQAKTLDMHSHGADTTVD